MKDQKEYWESRILDWEGCSYGTTETKRVSLVERIAHYFRGPVRYRPLLALRTLRALKPARVLELGCGSGRLAFQLVTEAGVRHVTGVDISEQAVRLAGERACARGLTDRLSFIASSIADLDFEARRPFDFVLGLGLTPYLREDEFTRLFQAIRGARFLFDVHPRQTTFANVGHALYRSIKGHPFYRLFGPDEILGKLAALGHGDVHWIEAGGVHCVTNLTELASGSMASKSYRTAAA